MCGIAGIFTRDRDQKIDEDRLRAMAELQNHRGPDNLGIEIYSTAGFAHNRLSLLDLSNHGNQPFCDDRYALVYNGEIYNWKTLRSELERESGIEFKSDCDTEVLFHSLRIHGAKRTLPRLEGMFAFAFYDIQQRELTLARDRIGIKPLFYHLSAGTLHFASELKALAMTTHPRLDTQRVLNSALGITETSRLHTNFTDIHQVEPGTLIRFSDTAWEARETWFTTADLVDADYYRHLDGLSAAQAVDEFHTVLQNSVQKMLIADAPIGAFVSGGIDSSLISVLAAEVGKNPRCYSVNVSGPLSEITAARSLAEQLGASLFEYEFQAAHFIQDWVKAAWNYDAPLVRHQHAVPFCNLTELARRQGDKAVLTGEGADELFFGYGPEVTARIANTIPAGIHRFFNRRLCRYSRVALGIPSGGDHLFEQLRNGVDHFEPQIRRKRYQDAFSFLPKQGARNLQARSLELIDTTLHSLLWRNDRMGMMNSIESRFPYLDETLLRFGVNLPPRFKVRPSLRTVNPARPYVMDKYLVRKLAARKLPRTLTHRKKHPFTIGIFKSISIGSEVFEGGLVQDLLQMATKDLQQIGEHLSGELVARLLGLDIWARLYLSGDGIEDTAHLVQRHCRLPDN